MQIRADRLKNIVSINESMIAKSKDVAASSERILYANSFFKKAVYHGRSICVLLDSFKEHQEADFAGISALARSLIETHNVFLYLTEPKIGRKEQDFRLGLMHLNQATDLLKIGRAFGAAEDGFMFWQRALAESSAVQLRKNQIFLSLDEKQRAHFLRGKNPYLKERYKGSHPLSLEIESAAYNLFSHNVHSFGLSSSYMGSSTPAGHFNVLFLAVEISTIYLAHLAKRYAKVRARAVGKLPTEYSKAITEVLSLEHLCTWQEYLRQEDRW